MISTHKTEGKRYAHFTTLYLRSFSADKPFTFEITTGEIDRLEYRKSLVRDGRSPLLGNSIEGLVESFEFSLFPSFKDLLKIFFADGYSDELINKILLDFGADESFIRELLRNEKFVRRVRPWFAGITCDGERAIRTMKIVYTTAQECWKSGAMDISLHEIQGQASLVGESKVLQA